MPRKILKGTVVSTKNDKTVIVSVERSLMHTLYGKTIKRKKKYHAHDENNVFAEGDMVRIIESKPRSALKRWEVLTETSQPQA